MKATPTPLAGLLIIETAYFGDERGWFTESFNEQSFRKALSDHESADPGHFVQDNHSCSEVGVLRGLHYQLAPYAQGKLVRVVHGAAFDVAVDLRRGSPSFGKWFGLELNTTNRRQLWIPSGFAHGFVALEDNTQFVYKTTNYYSRQHERSVAWNDPTINIAWPRSDKNSSPKLSEKDQAAPSLEQALKTGDVFDGDDSALTISN
jgi:dTDP-4-dehydrorhamnose 3,5-epimerase